MGHRRLSELLPEFPRTPHLPGSRGGDDDIVLEHSEAIDILREEVVVEEKLDGSNLAISWVDGHLVARNRRKFLHKGNLPKNPSGKQFLPMWNYMDRHRQGLRSLEGMAVYGEWLWMAHGIHYSRLPSYFIAFDLFDPGRGFLPFEESRQRLQEAGFETPPLIHLGKIDSYEQIVHWSNDISSYAFSPMEGLYFRMDNRRFKYVREEFEPGKFWETDRIIRNQCEIQLVKK